MDFNFEKFEELRSNTGTPHCMYPVNVFLSSRAFKQPIYIFLILCILVFLWIRTGTEENTLVSEQVFLALKITWGKARMSMYCSEVHQSLWNRPSKSLGFCSSLLDFLWGQLLLSYLRQVRKKKDLEFICREIMSLDGLFFVKCFGISSLKVFL